MSKGENIVVTGGAGFIGRWVLKALFAEKNNRIAVIDDLSNGSSENIDEFTNEPGFVEFIHGGIESSKRIEKVFKSLKPKRCLHLAAQIIVQASIDDPVATFKADVDGTFRLLEMCREHGASFLFMSTCMVYDLASATGAISEKHPVVPRSPYAGAKLAGENMAISYYHAYGMPVSVVRPFNTYGPFQKSSGEGGVISIFLSKREKGEDLLIYGDGTQTRDFLFVEDCADFVVRAAYSTAAAGRVLNAGSGKDISINDLARTVIASGEGKTKSRIRHIKHIHPQSEIQKLCCNSREAKKTLGWKPSVNLEKGLRITSEWINGNIDKGITTWS